MATNVEIKAKVEDFNDIRARAELLSDTPGELILQEDTFFHVPQGRLKLRVMAPKQGELIYYERQDAAGPKRSDYLISATIEPETLKEVLASSLGIRGIVRKRRWLYWVGNTRIHLDKVDDLGSFLELEVVLKPDQSAQQGEQTAVELMAQLGIEPSALIEGAYIDLLQK